MFQPVPLSVRRMALRAGLGDLNRPPACKGYANGCRCPRCTATLALIAEHRAAGRNPFTPEGKLAARPAKRQPWERAA